MHRGDSKFFFLVGNGFKGQNFTREVSGVDSTGALRQGVQITELRRHVFVKKYMFRRLIIFIRFCCQLSFSIKNSYLLQNKEISKAWKELTLQVFLLKCLLCLLKYLVSNPMSCICQATSTNQLDSNNQHFACKFTLLPLGIKKSFNSFYSVVLQQQQDLSYQLF